jgi:hypothetical protein
VGVDAEPGRVAQVTAWQDCGVVVFVAFGRDELTRDAIELQPTGIELGDDRRRLFLRREDGDPLQIVAGAGEDLLARVLRDETPARDVSARGEIEARVGDAIQCVLQRLRDMRDFRVRARFFASASIWLRAAASSIFSGKIVGRSMHGLATLMSKVAAGVDAAGVVPFGLGVGVGATSGGIWKRTRVTMGGVLIVVMVTPTTVCSEFSLLATRSGAAGNGTPPFEFWTRPRTLCQGCPERRHHEGQDQRQGWSLAASPAR